MKGYALHMVSYSPELASVIVSRVAAGETISKICRDPNMPDKNAVFDWIAKFPDLALQYARSVIARADARVDRIDDICEKMIEGRITSDVARVAIDAEKWQAGKENPKKYSDKTQIELTGKDGEPLSMRLIEAQQRLLKDVTPKQSVIEHAPITPRDSK